MNPYAITGPALISFSGGRTSAFMLRQILDAHGGTLPADVVVVFANTGKEREETLRFVHECETRWSVRIWWVEWRDTPAGYEVVGYNSASRLGEPFEALISKRGFVPNQGARYCSVTLKTRTIRNFAVGELGWSHWVNQIGLRYDEGMRVMKALARNDANKDRFKAAMPMAKARHTKRDVMDFWSRQPFDLGLRDYEGNCDLCFLKARGKLEALMRENPAMADWWIAQEDRCELTASDPSGARFRLGQPYAEIAAFARNQTHLFDILDDEEFDAECGLVCAGDAA